MTSARIPRQQSDPPVPAAGPSSWPPPADDPAREWWYAIDDCEGGSVFGPFPTPEARRESIRRRVGADTPVILFSGYNVSLEICPAGDA